MHDRLRIEFVTQLDAHLARTGQTRASLARKIGKSRAHVTKALAASNNLTGSTMSELASAAGLELHFRLVGPMRAMTTDVRDVTWLGLDPAYGLAA